MRLVAMLETEKRWCDKQVCREGSAPTAALGYCASSGWKGALHGAGSSGFFEEVAEDTLSHLHSSLP